ANLIAGTPDFRSVENIQRARTRGLGVSARVSMPGEVALRAGYTWLEADNLTAGTRLLRRPRHQATLDAWRELGAGLSAGAGVTWTAQREDVHAATFATVDGEDFTVVRFYGAWDASERVSLKLRIENLLDERYEEVHGYPATGFGAFAGVELRF
ncbi:MAG: TonB-dependent receptor, partial [Opitutus sp.]